MTLSQAQSNVLILTMGRDVHAAVIDLALRRLGVSSAIYSQTAFLGKGDASVAFNFDGACLSLNGWTGNLAEPLGTVWNRRRANHFLYPASVHPADKSHLRANAFAFLDGVGSLLDDARFCVNPSFAKGAAASKLRQLRLARAVGLAVPRTLVSNRYEEVTAFIRHVGRGCVKPFYVHGWKSDEGLYQSTTAIVEPGMELPRDSVELVPLIYQSYVEKQFEVRLSVFGGVAIGTKINSQSDAAGAIDWRNSFSYLDDLEPIDVPPRVVESSRALLRALGLRFGTFDFAVTPEGEWVFFEVNEAGQFLWQEEFCPDTKIIEPFARFLASAEEGFVWQGEGSEELSYASLWRHLETTNEYDWLGHEPSATSEGSFLDETTAVDRPAVAT